MSKQWLYNLGGIGLILMLTGCGQVAGSTTEQVDVPAPEQAEVAQETQPETATNPLPIAERLRDVAELPQPVNELADGEYTWAQLLGRDAIRPIYEDEVELVDAESAPYDDNELVIGVEINGEAKAYAIGPLNAREMVNDVVGGTPVLVTW